MARKSSLPPRDNLAVAYLRVSTEDQSNGIEAQRSAIERWAAQNGVEVSSWYEDRLSGTTALRDRPGLISALSQRPSTLILAKRDRLAQDVSIAATIVQVCKKAGIQLVFADGVSFADTPEGKLMATMLDAFAAYERDMIEFRTKVGLAAKVARGERVGRPPYGYRQAGTGLAPVAEEQAVIDRMWELRASGLSYQSITDRLNEEGLVPRSGQWWQKNVMQVMARNPR